MSVIVGYWFFGGFLTQYNPFCTSIISLNQITRAYSDNIIINNGHCSHGRTLCFWCKWHDEFIIATLLYPYFIIVLKVFFVTGSHSFPYSLVLNVRALTPWIMTIYYFLTERAIKHNRKPTATPPSTVIAATDNHLPKHCAKNNMYVALVLIIWRARQKRNVKKFCILKNTKTWRKWMVGRYSYLGEVRSKRKQNSINILLLKFC